MSGAYLTGGGVALGKIALGQVAAGGGASVTWAPAGGLTLGGNVVTLRTRALQPAGGLIFAGAATWLINSVAAAISDWLILMRRRGRR